LNIRIEMDTASVLSMLKTVKQDVLPLATARALNKTGISARSVAVKTMATEIGLPQKEVRPAVQLLKARPLCCDAVLCVVKDKRVPLIRIDPRAKQMSLGVSYRGDRGMQRSIPHAFIATMPSGHRGVYARKGRGRLPIRELLGPSLSYVFQQPAVQKAIAETVTARWPLCCEQESRYYLHKRRWV
jgi:hypothetical protein